MKLAGLAGVMGKVRRKVVMWPIASRFHSGFVHSRRVSVLSRHLSPLMPQRGTVVDVGAGDGWLAAEIQGQCPGIRMEGVDTLVRNKTHVQVRQFDGFKLPFDDNSVDAVLLVDVLHHTADPMVLLHEAKRVTRRSVIIKDHTRNGILAGQTLRFMDYVGNAHHGVNLPYNYWSLRQWELAFARLELHAEEWTDKLDLYPGVADWFFGRGLHFVTRLRKNT